MEQGRDPRSLLARRAPGDGVGALKQRPSRSRDMHRGEIDDARYLPPDQKMLDESMRVVDEARVDRRGFTAGASAQSFHLGRFLADPAIADGEERDDAANANARDPTALGRADSGHHAALSMAR